MSSEERVHRVETTRHLSTVEQLVMGSDFGGDLF